MVIHLHQNSVNLENQPDFKFVSGKPETGVVGKKFWKAELDWNPVPVGVTSAIQFVVGRYRVPVWVVKEI